MLGEKQQTAACKELARIINHQMNSIGIAVINPPINEKLNCSSSLC
jgi:hypothetical protein